MGFLLIAAIVASKVADPDWVAGLGVDATWMEAFQSTGASVGMIMGVVVWFFAYAFATNLVLRGLRCEHCGGETRALISDDRRELQVCDPCAFAWDVGGYSNTSADNHDHHH